MILVCSQYETANAVWKQTQINKSGTVIICIAYFSVAFFSRVIWFSPNARTFLAFRGERPPSERVPGVRVPAGISVPHWNFCGRLNKRAGTFIRYSRVLVVLKISLNDLNFFFNFDSRSTINGVINFFL